ncbi:MAG: hypothetical protein HN368_11775, partial [Spirochaetales bacterium]|nr:hypothetical protein [Spirochaetales bacterium]
MRGFRLTRISQYLSLICYLFLTACGSPLLAIEVELVKKGGMPDALHAIDGSPITSLSEWTQSRRDEIRELFQYYVYGYFPETPDLTFIITKEDPEAIPGLASYREIEIRFTIEGELLEETMTLAMFVPVAEENPPIFITLNRCGNHSIHHYDGISFPSSGAVLCGNQRGRMTNFWSVELLLSRGYAVVSFNDDDLYRGREPESPDLHSALLESSIEKAGGTDAAWGTISAWGWGYSRVIDYLVNLDEIDTERIAVIGHSRRGKSAFLAGAFDDRIAVTVAHQGGTGAEALNRRSVFQEPVFIMNHYFPTWFNSVYKTFNFKIRQLPVDQHQLMSLFAPRALLVTAARDYPWAGSKSSFRAMKAINPVYELYGSQGVIGSKPLSPKNLNAPIGKLVQIKDKGHNLSPQWWNSILE